jgi:hypothetical protein
MSRNFLAALLGALVGAGLVWLAIGGFARSPAGDGASVSPPSVISPPGSAAEIARLREELAQESARRQALAAQMDAETAPPPAQAALPAASAPAPEPILQDMSPERQAGEDSARPWFDAAALENEGWTPGEIQRIRTRWEEYELAKLEVENQRARKVPGWKQMGGRLFQIEAGVRGDLGDEGYEAMRFAASQPNRVVLSELLEISPASEAGLSAGDEVISYDGQRVFTAAALKYLTQAGTPGFWTEVRVLRAGEERRFFVRRGPLGARLEAVTRAPYR